MATQVVGQLFGVYLPLLTSDSNFKTTPIASHESHEKISSWVSFSFLYEYGAPLWTTKLEMLYLFWFQVSQMDSKLVKENN